MSSPPKKMRKSGATVAATAIQSVPDQNPNDDMQMDEEIDPASMYEDEEGCKLVAIENIVPYCAKVRNN